MRIYLAGPMQGYPEFNYPLFHAAANLLRQMGHDVFSPAERDIQRHGTDISKGNGVGSVKQAELEHGFCRRTALAEDADFINRHADAIALLPGWEHSSGALAEWTLARAHNLKFVYLYLVGGVIACPVL